MQHFVNKLIELNKKKLGFEVNVHNNSRVLVGNPLHNPRANPSPTWPVTSSTSPPPQISAAPKT